MKKFRKVLIHTLFGYVMLKTEQNDRVKLKKKNAGWNLGSPTY